MKVQSVRICGFSKDEILDSLKGVEGRGVTFSVTEKHLDALLTLKAEDSMPDKDFNDVLSDALAPFKVFVYAEGDVKLPEMIFKLLQMTKNVVSVAESLTGGAVAARLIEVPGISENFYEGIVAYDNRAKQRRLGVYHETLVVKGAVSRECAYEMADGLLAERRTTVALSTTGIAGPSGGTDKKPVGTVYIGVGDENYIEVFHHVFKGNRTEIRMAATNMALFYLLKFLKGDLLELKLLGE